MPFEIVTKGNAGSSKNFRFFAMLRMTGWGWALALLVIVTALACASPTPVPTPTPTPPPDPRQVLADAADRVTSLESVRFDLEHLEGSTQLLPGIEMTRAYGVADLPEKFRLTVEAQAAGTYVESGIAVLGDQSYMTNFLTGRWQQVPLETLPFDFSSLGEDLAQILKSVQDPALAGEERLADYDTWRIRGRVDSGDLASLAPAATPGFDVDLDLWIDRSESWLLRAEMNGPVVATDPPESARLLTLDGINQPVEVTLPE